MEQAASPQPLPRDSSRFRRLSPEPAATIRPDADTALACLSTIELINMGKSQALRLEKCGGNEVGA